MNPVKRLIIIVYCIGVAAMLVYVPWAIALPDWPGAKIEKGYGFIFGNHNPTYEIDLQRLVIQILIFTAFSVLAYFLTKRRGKKQLRQAKTKSLCRIN